MTNSARERRVLAAIEMSDIGERSVRWAHALATALGIDLVVAAALGNPSSERSPDTERRFLDEAGERLAAWAAGLELGEIRTVSLEPSLHTHVAATAQHDDIVVVGVHAKEGATSWALNTAPHKFGLATPRWSRRNASECDCR